MNWQNACHYQTIKIEDNFTIQLVSSYDAHISATAHAEIEAIWETERQRNGMLFNGTIFSALNYDATTMTGRWISYCEALAGYRNADLAKRLRILPVAVSGVLWAGDHVLFGQRSSHLAQYPGYLELAPSGGLDQLDFRKVVLNELQEETGISASAVDQLRPFAIARQGDLAPVEICVTIALRNSAPPDLRSSDEYQQFFWVRKPDIPAFLASSQHPIVPLSAHLVGVL